DYFCQVYDSSGTVF
nr:immunoglobulin light chain junction region [Macaca mulatta]